MKSSLSSLKMKNFPLMSKIYVISIGSQIKPYWSISTLLEWMSLRPIKDSKNFTTFSNPKTHKLALSSTSLKKTIKISNKNSIQDWFTLTESQSTVCLSLFYNWTNSTQNYQASKTLPLFIVWSHSSFTTECVPITRRNTFSLLILMECRLVRFLTSICSVLSIGLDLFSGECLRKYLCSIVRKSGCCGRYAKDGFQKALSIKFHL